MYSLQTSKRTNERMNEWKKKQEQNEDGTTRKVSYVMHCIPFAYRCVCLKVKEKTHTFWKKAAKKRHVEYFSVTRYLFSCLWHWQRRPFRSLHVRAIHNQTHTPRVQSIRAGQQTCMQNKSISKCYLHAAMFLIIFSDFFRKKERKK